MQAVREGLDGTSSGGSAAYEALERLKQDVRLEKNAREAAEVAAVKYRRSNELVSREALQLEEENERLRRGE